MALVDRNLRSSVNYIWNTSAVLGKGATGSVYQGMSKHTGEIVAVKSFNHLSQMRPYEVQRREYEVLSKVNHENIVKLLAIEEESESQNKVLIMELCTGGSLFNILDDPANSFGLDENEFLLVLKHLTAGMKHLRDMNIIHRDLKPGNIMKFLSEDGNSIYKLTDFGAARELEEDQQFMSLYGTEEYLHPELYARAVLRKPAAKSFSAKVDLWSIGVTLFHIATGSLPFRPYGGRKNKEMMHKITTEKQKGIISGIQHSDNGDIEWNANLPKTCLLSPSLQEKVTPLLAGLLEYNPKNMWTFDQFFKSVTHILSHKPVYVFCVNSICDYTFYIQPNEKISHLKARLASKETAGIPIPNQLMIHNKRELSDDEPIKFVSPDQPIILINSKATSIKVNNLITSNQFKFPDILSQTSTSNIGEHDAQQSKACASIAYCIQRTAVKSQNYCNFINQVPQQVMSLIEGNVKLLNEKRESCSHLIESLRDQIEYISVTTINLSKCSDKIDLRTTMKVNAEIGEIRLNFSDKLEKTWKELLPKIIDISERVKNLADRWQSEPGVFQARVSRARARSDYLCARIKESWVFLHKNKSSRSLGGYESQLHHLEKMRIDANCKKLIRLLYEDIHQALNELVERLDDWYNDAHVALVQSGCLFDELSRLMKSRDRILEQLNDSIESQHLQWQKLINQLAHMSKLNQSQQLATNNIDEVNTSSNLLDKRVSNMTDKGNRLGSNAIENLTSNSHLSLEKISFECAHNQDNLIEEIQNLKEAQRRLCASLSENQNLFSELVSITISAKNSDPVQ
jgi:TANK-binding kinase 1